MCAEEVGRQLDRAGHLAKGVSPQPDPGEPGFQIALPSPGNRPAFHPDSSRVPLSRHLLGDTVVRYNSLEAEGSQAAGTGT